MTHVEPAPDTTGARVDPDTSPEGSSAVPGGTKRRNNLYTASQWRLMWWRFRKHKLAMVSAIFVVFVYLLVLFAEFFAPFHSSDFDAEYQHAPPQSLHLFEETDDGTRFNPHVKGFDYESDEETWRRTYTTDESEIYPVRPFVHGHEYELFGLITTDIHLFGPTDPDAPMYLFGADRNGRDILSRVIYGTQISMSIGVVGVVLSLVLGIVLGGVSGYFGGWIDSAIQRVIEFVRSLPEIPLWMALAAALPQSWSQVQVYFGITVILSIVGWTTLARVVRGKFFSLREEDFVTAAVLDGVSKPRVIFRHMLPSFTSHIIAAVTLAIPAMILAETALSFLGLGLTEPTVSWGVLLREAQDIPSIAHTPWVLIVPAVAVITTVLALNFLGDGLRDAADPYNK
ncbi:ABC transporter permease [Actinobacteria bacterium YIM 96077]|uniref:Oligopeptide transport system permease protein OppC n=1 Tax=Phytoactinopolyspora halophila TaxID=1981511 RepID=A0A329QYE8_9ACTN|nr:ABC transporter permease [Phytoactinopolyspora halophila]AYY13788.1 ABC transporter permease [Actinobacteria bacterium YIM 96077]RAW15668.1 ABC transporter permease [Phytoactinopolyspora halophila]